MSISAMKQGLEAFRKIHEGCGEVKKDNLSKESNKLATLVRKDCNFAMDELRQAIADAEKREWVGLSDEEVQDAGRYSYVRGATSERLYHIMWNSQPSASVGWCREELIAFAQTIEASIKDKNT
jgi:hypothetical protein